MKYITTKDHPELKEGIEFDHEQNQGSCVFARGGVYFEQDVKHGLSTGHIKEVEEKEFTRSDILDFGKFFTDRRANNYCLSLDEEFNQWLKQRSND